MHKTIMGLTAAYEEGGMLEAWARLYQLTGEEKYHTLTERYSDPGLFRKLLAGAHKKWGTKTRDFWCCHGTMVQTAGMKYYNDQASFMLIAGLDSIICAREIRSRWMHSVMLMPVSFLKRLER